jgi:hypothetical protein
MKRIIRILVLAITFVTGVTTLSAQTVQVLLTQKVPALPSTAISYLEGPFRYFNTQFIVTGAGSEGLDIFFDMEMTVNTSPLYVRTRPGTVPMLPIHLSEGVNIMRDDELNTQVLIRTETNYDYSDLMNVQQLPEGTYTICLDFYRWSDKDNPNRVPITIGPCPTFEICYSGSAPELVSPMAGAQMNLNGNMVLTPARKINFFWTPVISNCSGRNTRFKYKLKVVKVLNGQNYQDAIKYNPTVLSTEVRNTNHAVFDTLRDIKVQMERGRLYVAQVEAEQIKFASTTENFIISNEGKSQPMPFFWGYSNEDNLSGFLSGRDEPINIPPGTIGEDINNPKNKSSRRYGYSVEDESEEGEESEGVEGLTQWEGGVEEVSELETVQDEMKMQYLAGFIQDVASVASLTEAYPDERKYVPTPKRHYVESDGYYTVPMTDDLEVSFMPTRHESLKNVSYAIELYENIEGADIDSITSYEPLFVEEIKELPDSYNKKDSHDLINRTLTGWGTELEQGSLYYLQLTSFYKVEYWKYSIADTLFYVNEMLAEHVHDTTSRDFIEEEFSYSNGVMFRWGDDPETPDFKTPQWKSPVDRTSDDIYDPVNYGLPTSVPEVEKTKTFPITWTPVKNVAKGDTVEYEVNVYELKPDQTLEEALSDNEALVTRTVTDANEISENDKDFFKVFSPKKTYVMTLSTNVDGESDTVYHFENGNSALPIVFKVVK